MALSVRRHRKSKLERARDTIATVIAIRTLGVKRILAASTAVGVGAAGLLAARRMRDGHQPEPGGPQVA